MDQLKQQKIVECIKAHYYLFKLTQLLVSLSLCSFILSPSSLFVFLHYFKFYLSTLPSQLFNHNIDKNCMFLFCNGLLVFVSITKAFSGSSSADDQDKQTTKYIEDDSRSHFQDVDEVNEPMLENKVEEKTFEPHEVAEEVIEIENCDEEAQENIERIILVDEEQGKESSQIDLEEEEELDDDKSEVFDDEEEEEDEVFDDEEENIEEEEESCVISTEELNKKFEDFIRKMKQDLRIEAQRQLVMV